MQYLLESSICLALLYAFYYLVLRQESFFQFNRGYLLLAPLLAFTAPALNIQLEKRQAIQAVDSAPEAEATAVPVVAWPAVVERMQAAPRLIGKTLEKPVWELSLGAVLWWIYAILGTLFLLRLLVRIYRLVYFIRLCKKEARNGFVQVTTPAETPIASFFGFVFWTPGTINEEDRRLIFEHEMVHVRQWHSLDLIFIELLVALQWFNPLLYMYRRSLREVHEYIADDYVVRRTRQHYAYAALLVRQHTGNGAQPGLVNTFHSLIQKRLVMLAKLPSRPLRRAKYLLALPLFAMLMLLFSFRLADKIPEVRKAAALLETYTGTIAEITVLGARPVEHVEPKPFILYWGFLEARLAYDEMQGQYTADLQLPRKTLLDAIAREPRLWTGETLAKRLSFDFNGIAIKSNHNNPDVYLATRTKLESAVKELKGDDQVSITNISLPDGQKGRINIFVEKTPEPITFNDVLPMRTIFGNENFTVGEKRFMTVSDFWETMKSEAKVQYSDQKERKIKAWNFAISYGNKPVVRARVDYRGALTQDQLREILNEKEDAIKPGATISFSAWVLESYPPVEEPFEAIVTFDPETHEKIVHILTEDGKLTNFNPVQELFSIAIIGEMDEDPKPELPAKFQRSIYAVTMSVSPNPGRSNEAATVSARVEKSGEGLLTVNNLEGKQLFTKKVALEVGENKLDVPAQALKIAGVYIIQLEMPYGSGSAKLVVE